MTKKPFSRRLKDGSYVSGLYSDDTIYVHTVNSNGAGLHALIDPLVSEFKTWHVVFTPLINDQLMRVVNGRVEIIPPDNPENPYGEAIETLVCEWRVKL